MREPIIFVRQAWDTHFKKMKKARSQVISMSFTPVPRVESISLVKCWCLIEIVTGI